MLRKSLLIFLTSTLLATLPLAQRASAQHEYSRFELGAQYSTIRETNADFHAANLSGLGGRFDWNLTRRLAIESQVDVFPERALSLPLVQGGHTLQGVFGARAKVIQKRDFAVFGLIRPGLLHFTQVAVPATANPLTFSTQPATYFVLNLGGGLEYYPSPRWILRADIEGDPYRVPAFNLRAAGGGIVAGAGVPGKVNDTTRLSFGVAYRPGRLVEIERETKVPGNWEFGPLFSTLVIAREGLGNVRSEPGVGGYASYRFYSVLYLDSDLLYFPRTPEFSGPHDGGTILQGLFGLKGGVRRNRMGFFGKARPGFHSYSQALTSVSTSGTGPTFFYGRSNNLVLDLGGIIEFYPAGHGTLRVEVGDTHLFFGTRDVNVNGSAVAYPGGKMQHSIQLVLGYGWRF